ncbi:MAG: alpha/beta fold hydrolase [Elsteraceae bacterium]
MTDRFLDLPDGARLRYAVEGAGPPLLLIAGLGGAMSVWGPQVETLAGEFELIRFDQRGVAGSTRGESPVTIETLADDATAVARAVTDQPFSILGHSTGGVIAMTMTQGPAPIDRLIISASWLRPDAYIEALFALRLKVLRLAGFSAYEQLGKLLACSTPQLALADIQPPVDLPPGREAAEWSRWSERIAALLAFDGTELAPKIQRRTLVIGAPDDQIIPYTHQKAIAAAIPGAQLKTIPEGGHFFPRTQKELFAAEVIQFLKG